MTWREKLKEIFGDRQGAAAERVRKQIAQRCDWGAIKQDVFPDNGGGAPLPAVVDAIITAKHWKLLTPLTAEAGDWLSVIDLIYRKGEYGAVPPDRAQELEEIYQALAAAPKHGGNIVRSFVNTIEIWACQHGSEACFDWARGKPEFVPVPPLGLAALADGPIEGNPLAMKILSSPEEIKRAVEAVDWVYNGHSFDRDTALDNLDDWRRKLEGNSQNPSFPAPGPL